MNPDEVMAETREIPLTQGKVAIVDAEDYDWLNQWKWFAVKKPNTFYAVRTIRKPSGERVGLRMHRFILDTPKGMDTDHINGEGLDNRRVNLRICTHQENCCNRKLQSNNTSGCKGVHWHMRDKRWHAYIKINGKMLYLGRYHDLNEAIAARRVKEKEAFGDFAYLNEVRA